MIQFGEFLKKPNACGQTELPDMSVLIGQKLSENAKNSNGTFWVDKSSSKMPKMDNLTSFWKSEAFGQTELPDMSVLIGQKLLENAEVQKFKCDILGDFQTLWDAI